MWFCSWLWLATLIRFLLYKIAIEGWRPHTLSDFILLAIMPVLAYFPFLVVKTTQRLIRRSAS